MKTEKSALPKDGEVPELVNGEVSRGANVPSLFPVNSRSKGEGIINCFPSAPQDAPALKRQQRLTDIGNAERLVVKHGVNIRWVAEFKRWIVWDGLRWTPDVDGAIMRFAKKTAEQIYREAAKAQDREQARTVAAHADKSQNLPSLHAMIELAKSEPGITISQKELDQDDWLLGVNNGVIDLRTGRLRKSRREEYVTKHAHVDYEDDSHCPTWISFLDKITGGNVHLVEFLQRAIGYSLTGNVSEQCLFFLHGMGANGKSTFLNVIREMLGGYATQCAAETLMVKREGSATNDIARLRGMRFVATSETDEGRRFGEATVKQLTGGDDIAARFLYGEHFVFKPTSKIWLAANHKPVIRGDDYAIWRRIHLVPFSVTFSLDEMDRKLGDKLRLEYSGILAWAVNGCLDWQRQGLNPPREVTGATDLYRKEMDLVGDWLESCCIQLASATSAAKSLYSSFKRHTENSGRDIMNSCQFGRKLTERGFTKDKRGTVFYHGIGLLDGSDSSEGFGRISPSNTYMGILPEKLSEPSKLSNSCVPGSGGVDSLEGGQKS
ncbi:putative DNA primase/helicase [Nitrosospira sp. Nsp2]|uniref:DNA primase family protein n=1 Tax=Nitrosospira sp. Nsp2 TaxID=136548 RepID=UPI000D325135|nr:phage/plasmid primase, P4 family [Nitrosospira sp. Nsp2]PTR14214.1 putative DNA primase/helicase [Nitrosospira sp. Nsp2]